MNRRRVAFAVVGALALVVVALGASTLTTTQGVAGGDAGDGPGERPQDSVALFGGSFGILAYLLFGAFAALAGVAILYMLTHPVTAVELLLRVAALTVGVGVLWAVLLWLTVASGEEDDPPPERDQRTPAEDSTGGEEGLGDAAGDAVGQGVEVLLQDPNVVLVALLAALAAAVAAAAYLTDAGEATDDSFGYDRGEDRLSAVGRVAGEAADRIDGDAAVDNEVYRAWRRMTELLDAADEAARTPGEFHRAAVDAGMDPDDVAELTALFEAVRYGPADADADRERRAREALRAIEATYTEGEP
jgi:hypothetical protein